jgi:hypothetical protein
MHVARQFDVADFDIVVDGVQATREDVFPAWNEWDRLGIVVDRPFGALGANALIQLATTAFYDVKPVRREGFPTPEAPRSDLAVYPEIYVFHVGGRHGLYSAYDFWPARKEVILPAAPRVVLDAINDRAITRLLVPDAAPRFIEHEYKEPAIARDRITSAFTYSADGRVQQGQIEISTRKPTLQANARQALLGSQQSGNLAARLVQVDDIAHDPDLLARHWTTHSVKRGDEASGHAEAAQRMRAALRNGGRVTETYGHIDVDHALQLLTGFLPHATTPDGVGVAID